jgi:hypothetical protein
MQHEPCDCPDCRAHHARALVRDAREMAVLAATPRLAHGTSPGTERSPLAEPAWTGVAIPVAREPESFDVARCPGDRCPVCWLLVPNLAGRGDTVYPHDTGLRIPGVRTPQLCAGSFRSRR